MNQNYPNFPNVPQGGQNPFMQQPPNMPGPNMTNPNMPYSPYGPNMIPAQMGGYSYIEGDNNLESRVTRLERQFRKLESRVSRIESNADLISDKDDISSTTNMYMI